MKWIYTLSFLLLAQLIIAQNVRIEKDPNTDMYTYQEVIPIESMTAQAGFDKANYWISKNYKFLNEVIQLDKPDKKEIIFDSFLRINWMMQNGEITHKLILEFKEGRVRITANHFSYFTPESGDQSLDGMIMFKKSLIQHTEEKLQRHLRRLIDEIAGLSSSSEDDDW